MLCIINKYFLRKQKTSLTKIKLFYFLVKLHGSIKNKLVTLQQITCAK